MKLMEFALVSTILLVLVSAQQNFCSCGNNTGYHFDIDTGKCATLEKGDTGYVENCYQYRKDKDSKEITCITCDKQYALDKPNNKCLKHNLGKCYKPVYKNPGFQCNEGCFDGQIYDIEAQTCLPAENSISNCLANFKNESKQIKCHACKKTYYLKTDTECEKFPESGAKFVQNCDDYEMKQGDLKCTSCTEGHYLNFQAQKCVDIKDTTSSDSFYVQKCTKYENYSDDTVKCGACVEGYHLKGENSCAVDPTSSEEGYDANCQTYLNRSGLICNFCKDGFYKNGARVCTSATKVVENCSFYSYKAEISGTVCGVCKNGYYTKDNKETCPKCPAIPSPKPQPKPQPVPSSANQLQLQASILFLLLLTFL